MSLTEPNPPSEPGRSNGHAGGDIASEELVGQLTSGEAPRHGHFTTHFDEASIDHSVERHGDRREDDRGAAT